MSKRVLFEGKRQHAAAEVIRPNAWAWALLQQAARDLSTAIVDWSDPDSIPANLLVLGDWVEDHGAALPLPELASVVRVFDDRVDHGSRWTVEDHAPPARFVTGLERMDDAVNVNPEVWQWVGLADGIPVERYVHRELDEDEQRRELLADPEAEFGWGLLRSCEHRGTTIATAAGYRIRVYRAEGCRHVFVQRLDNGGRTPEALRNARMHYRGLHP